jgi:excisionase family DNA binding protein
VVTLSYEIDDVSTPDEVCADMLAAADTAGTRRFVWYGFLISAVVGLQLAIWTDRLSALVCGGWPPLGAPYRDIEPLAVTVQLAERDNRPRAERIENRRYRSARLGRVGRSWLRCDGGRQPWRQQADQQSSRRTLKVRHRPPMGSCYPAGNLFLAAGPRRERVAPRFRPLCTSSALVPVVPPAWAMGRTVFIDEAAAVLGVSRRTVYYRIRAGRLKTIRTRCGSQRVLVASIQRLLQEQADERRADEEERRRLETEALPL